jgi:hypothetical protein
MKETVSIVLDLILEQRERIALDKAIPFQSIRYGSLKSPDDIVSEELGASGTYQILLWSSPMSLRRIIERLQGITPPFYELDIFLERDDEFNVLLVQKAKKIVFLSLLILRAVLLFSKRTIMLRRTILQ